MENNIPIPTEDDECLTLVEHLETLKMQGKVWLFTHIPNETYTKSWAVKGRNKRLGVRKGFPDYVVLMASGAYFIEMKRTKGGETSADQKDWIEALTKLGYKAKVCKGYEEAREFLHI